MTANSVPDDPRYSWRDDAACLEHPAEWFTGPHQPGDTKRAIDVCDTCPVKQPCLETALQIEVTADLGIWGGTTQSARQRIRRERAHKRVALQAQRRTPPPTVPSERPEAATDGLRLVQDDHGDFVDQSGRVIVFEVHGDPPLMVMVDGKPRARATTLDEAAGFAARHLTPTTGPVDLRVTVAAPLDVSRRRS
jgi:WhiB family transcriptional regulator, redox-sensing transcriptional regulator